MLDKFKTIIIEKKFSEVEELYRMSQFSFELDTNTGGGHEISFSLDLENELMVERTYKDGIFALEELIVAKGDVEVYKSQSECWLRRWRYGW